VYVGGGFIGGSIRLDGSMLTGPANIFMGFLATLTDPTLLPTRAVQAVPALALWPNPARATATVQLPALAVGPITLTLLDALGRPVRTETPQLATYATQHPLDLTGLAPGLYLVRLSTNGTTVTQRLVVE
jgi:hypothetical protein